MSEFDDTLTRLFAKTRETLPADDFLARVTSRVERESRRRAIKRAALAIAAVTAAVVLTPYVVAGSLAVGDSLEAQLPALGNSLTSPIAWLSSLVLVAWGVRRARRAR